MRFVFFILLVVLIAAVGFWHTLFAILGAVLLFFLFIPLLIVTLVTGGILLLAGMR